MSKKLAKIVALVMALAMVFALAACGETEDPTNESKPVDRERIRRRTCDGNSRKCIQKMRPSKNTCDSRRRKENRKRRVQQMFQPDLGQDPRRRDENRM